MDDEEEPSPEPAPILEEPEESEVAESEPVRSSVVAATPSGKIESSNSASRVSASGSGRIKPTSSKIGTSSSAAKIGTASSLKVSSTEKLHTTGSGKLATSGSDRQVTAEGEKQAVPEEPPKSGQRSRSGSIQASPSRLLRTSRRASALESGLPPMRRFSMDRRASRRMSSLSGSIMSFRRHSADVDKVKAVKFMNTYRTESKNPFNVDRVNVILKSVMESSLEEIHYEASSAPKISMQLSSDIRSRVKALNFDRYKIVVRVELGQKNMQGTMSVMRFLWDREKDNYAFQMFENMSLYAVACVFGIYYD